LAIAETLTKQGNRVFATYKNHPIGSDQASNYFYLDVLAPIPDLDFYQRSSMASPIVRAAFS